MGHKQSDTTKHACRQALHKLDAVTPTCVASVMRNFSPDHYPFHCPKLTSTKLHVGLAQVEILIIIFEVGL